MAKFTAQDVINVFLFRWKTREFLSHLKPVSLLSKFADTHPMLERKGELIKFKEIVND